MSKLLIHYCDYYSLQGIHLQSECEVHKNKINAVSQAYLAVMKYDCLKNRIMSSRV